MDLLSNDSLIEIFIHLGFPNRLSQISKLLYNLSKDKHIWHTLLKQKYPIINNTFNDPQKCYHTIYKVSPTELLAKTLGSLKTQSIIDDNVELLQYIIKSFSIPLSTNDPLTVAIKYNSINIINYTTRDNPLLLRIYSQ